MSRGAICDRLRKHAETALAENNKPAMCRTCTSKLKSLIAEDPEVSQYMRRVLTVYYRTGDSQRTIWDHNVLTAAVPDLVVIEPRMHFLSEESGGKRGVQGAVFIGSLRAWQLRLERTTRGVIIDFDWSDLLPSDFEASMKIAQVLEPQKARLMRVEVK